MHSDPTSDFLFIHLACCNAHHNSKQFVLRRIEIASIEQEECDGSDRGSSLVPIDKGVSLANAASIDCCKMGQVRLRV